MNGAIKPIWFWTLGRMNSQFHLKHTQTTPSLELPTLSTHAYQYLDSSVVAFSSSSFRAGGTASTAVQDPTPPESPSSGKKIIYS
jgi:hypothetical protein